MEDLGHHTAHSNKKPFYSATTLTPLKLLINILTTHARHSLPRYNSSRSLLPSESLDPTTDSITILHLPRNNMTSIFKLLFTI